MKKAKVLGTIALMVGCCGDAAAMRRCPVCSSPTDTESLETSLKVSIPKGLSTVKIVSLLAKEGVLRYPVFFLLRVAVSGAWGRLQAGVYRFPRSFPHAQLLTALRQGHVLVHKLTLPEGVTVAAAFDILNEHACLMGPMPPVPVEGHLLPGTYLFVTGDTRSDLVTRMERALDQKLASLPLITLLADKEQLLILASIVERETRLPEEKGRVAGVFLRRLQEAIPLQADPTVVYGLTMGSKKLGRLLTRADLKVDGAYNTYTRKGLPPTPICCPGEETLDAVAGAAPGHDLFFVTDGNGGHRFSATLSEHNANVQDFRRRRRG